MNECAHFKTKEKKFADLIKKWWIFKNFQNKKNEIF